MPHVFIIGIRGLPASYGGFETFVEELISHRVTPDIHYHVACLSDEAHQTHFDYKGVDCFTIKPPKLGAARVIAYDFLALTYALSLVKTQGLERPIFYFLGNTLGGFMPILVHRIRAVGGVFYINPDGLEWKRSKWSKPVQAYLKLAEKAMCQTADLVIADNPGIESYIQNTYPLARTTCIAYGTRLEPSRLTPGDKQVRDYFSQHDLWEKSYYLVLGRFVPENNYETILREFMASKTKRSLVIVTNHENSPFFETLQARLDFKSDGRVKFVGSLYDSELVTYLRNQAFAYLHGHEVGGTNPSLLESMAQTDLSLVLDVTFNRQVAKDRVRYWDKGKGNLTKLINQVDRQSDWTALGLAAKQEIREHYRWEKIVREYEDLFTHDG